MNEKFQKFCPEYLGQNSYLHFEIYWPLDRLNFWLKTMWLKWIFLWGHQIGKIGNMATIFANFRAADGPCFCKLPIVPTKCLQNSKFCQSDDLTNKFKTFPFHRVSSVKNSTHKDVYQPPPFRGTWKVMLYV